MKKFFLGRRKGEGKKGGGAIVVVLWLREYPVGKKRR